MNISEAKEEIQKTIEIYLKKDEFGRYKIAKHRQRPIFLLGAPGIGKTAIMAQIANEMDLGFVSYSMTHHTRQSALGLPYIAEKIYDGKVHKVSEYTMSEIIASIYDTMEKSGKKEGILFLDEINCVSETLAPAILEFLQYKVFGRHHVPDGWIVVTAGNPPEYNKSVREMDLATLDRLKILDVKEDYSIWRTYAKKVGIHGAITNYLDLKKKDFYRIETTIDGKEYVTARGWEDLSESLTLYEENQLDVSETFIYQYLHHPQVSKSFVNYYDLYQSYKEAYDVQGILNGEFESVTIEKLKEASFDEQLSLVGLVVSALNEKANLYQEEAAYLAMLLEFLKTIKTEFLEGKNLKESVQDALENCYDARNQMLENGSLDKAKNTIYLKIISLLEDELYQIEMKRHSGDEFDSLKARFDEKVEAWEILGEKISQNISFSISFSEKHFADGELFLIFLTELAKHDNLARIIAERSIESYYQHSDKLSGQTEGAKLQKLAQNHFKDEL